MGLWCESCTNFIFENLEIRNYTDVGIGVYLSSDIIMRNLVVHNNGFAVQLRDWELEGYGIHVDESQRILVEGKVFCYLYHSTCARHSSRKAFPWLSASLRSAPAQISMMRGPS